MARLKHDLRPCKRWRDASLKTSFIAHVLVFLLVALAGSLATSSAFAKLQSVATEDAREVAGLYLYDGDRAALVPAESVPVDGNGASVFVGVARQDMALLPLGQLPPRTWIEDVSDYRPLTLSDIGGAPGSMVTERGKRRRSCRRSSAKTAASPPTTWPPTTPPPVRRSTCGWPNSPPPPTPRCFPKAVSRSPGKKARKRACACRPWPTTCIPRPPTRRAPSRPRSGS